MSEPASCPECGCLLDDPRDHSDPARRRFFAILREVWQTLPEELSRRYPSSEHLRKAALVTVGWCDSKTVACGSKAAALEVAAMAQYLDRYAVVAIVGPVVTVYTARSMSKRQCPKKSFMELTGKVFDWLSQLVGNDVERAAGAKKFNAPSVVSHSCATI